MSSQSPVYHESDYQHGKLKDGAWYCKHGNKAAERVAMNSRSLEYVGMKFWTCVNRPSCRFFLWQDHVEEALKYHQAPQDVIEKMTPRKRKRDGDITEYFPITPKTPRTRDVRVDDPESEDDIYELSDIEASPSRRHRADSSPTPLRRRSNAPSRSLGPPSPPSSWEDALQEVAEQLEQQAPPLPPPPAYTAGRPYSVLNTLLSAPVIVPSNAAPRVQVQPPPLPPVSGSSIVAPQVPLQAPPRPSTPPRTARAPADAHAPSVVVEPRTPKSHTRGRPRQEMPPPNPPTPDSGKRRLSARELETYNVIIKALAGANVKLSVKGQNALRDIVKEDDFWMGS
ncbi:hypothetical protein NKR19_g4523 [Coniochaeta hoffmannii]|uniref:GRF-type domain-containing protein n=1 Tax=Coniochaeta hoffmannii TaxID=91930 RepID=A0AA38VUV2_9PEZI|nr:hypothetical protein NKR19_g4523 [Coniochaeta hoffmannii]